ncbi:MAG: MBL fold metallo-hydrolase [candidate division WOR-3 bacterium]
MKFGSFELILISDGSFLLDGGTMFGVVPKVLWQKIWQPDDLNRIEIPLNCLLIKTPQANILVDTGIGNKLDNKFREIYCVKQVTDLAHELAKHGVKFEDVDFVVNTHLHFDHCGWNTILSASDTVIPAFPNARYVIQKQEWYDANHPNERTRASYIKENYLPLEGAGLLKLVDGDSEIIPGVRVLNTIGHTKGHQSVLIESGGKKAIYWGDFMPTSAHLRIPYHTSFDLYPMELVELKKKYLRRAIDENWLMIFEHDPNVGFGYLVEEGGKPVLKPVVPEE